MHAVHLDPRILVAALAALILALMAAMAPRALDDLSFGGGSSAAGTTTAAAPARSAPPAWVKHPLQSPLLELQRR